MSEIWIAVILLAIGIAGIVALAGKKKGPETPSYVDDDFHVDDADKGWEEGPIHMETTAGGSTSDKEEPEAYAKSREAVKKGLFSKNPEFEDPGDSEKADPAPEYSHLKTGPRGGFAYKTEEKDITPPEVETYYTYKARVNVRMCPFCGCENSVAEEHCGCCGECI